MEQSASGSMPAIMAVVASVVAIGLSLVISRALRDGQWPFRLASASLVGPAATVVLSVQAITSSLQRMAVAGSGGFGYVAASMAEAYRPILYAASVSLALLAAAGLAGVIRWGEPLPGTSLRRPLILLLGGVALFALPIVFLREFMGLIIAVATPANSVAAATPYAGVPSSLAGVSQRVTSLILLTAGTGLAAAASLLVASILAGRLVRGRTSRLGAIVLLGTSALALAVLIGHSYFWSARLWDLAIRGR